MKALRRAGYTDQEIKDAIQWQEMQRRQTGSTRSLQAILRGEKGRSVVPTDLTERQLRRRGRMGQAALLLDQQALTEIDPNRADQVRQIAAEVKALAKKPDQLEFDFWAGGIVTADQYHDAIRERLLRASKTPAEALQALAVLQEIKRWLGWQSFTCMKTAAELSELLQLDKGNLSRSMRLLETVGAIHRVTRGRTKVITVTPEGAFRGNVNNHGDAVERYRAEVVSLFPQTV
ncbi:MAG: transcriptional regulator [Azonexus sp.]|nr:hypothetical protein [Azonexus sp.]MCK6413912.1 transcriptional regulator [Azonexus sp.]